MTAGARRPAAAQSHHQREHGGRRQPPSHVIPHDFWKSTLRPYAPSRRTPHPTPSRRTALTTLCTSSGPERGGRRAAAMADSRGDAPRSLGRSPTAAVHELPRRWRAPPSSSPCSTRGGALRTPHRRGALWPSRWGSVSVPYSRRQGNFAARPCFHRQGSSGEHASLSSSKPVKVTSVAAGSWCVTRCRSMETSAT